jgi:FAD/FMN-containing dehydrogenase
MPGPTTPPTDSSLDAVQRDGTSVSVERGDALDLGRRMDGGVVLPGDDDYDTVRRVWNGMIDRGPAVIAQCATSEDVGQALAWARERDLPISVRGGGHNAAGVALVDRGVVVDLAPMKDIEVLAGEEPARVRVGGGVTIGELDAATQQHGLAVPLGVVTETGIAGLTLGGGFGWLRRLYGLSCDNLVSAEVVLADGRVVTASEDANADLLWGLRGGGGNYGVVTSFEFLAHPLGPDVHFAVVFHAASDVAEGLRFYREWADQAPDEISSMAVLWHAPEMDEIPAEHHGTPILTFLAVHSGTPEEGAAALSPLQAHGSPIADLSGATPWLEVQQFFDEDYPKWVRRYYWTSSYVTDLPDELVDRLVALNDQMPSHHSTIDVWQGGGASSRVASDATAVGRRDAAFMLGIEANWDDAEDDEANIEWARRVVAESEPWATGARYANFPGMFEEGEGPDFFGGTEDRARELKARYDPENVFDRNHNVTPAAAG